MYIAEYCLPMMHFAYLNLVGPLLHEVCFIVRVIVKKCIQNFWSEVQQEKKQLGKSAHVLGGHYFINFKEMGFEDVDWINQTQDMGEFQALVIL